MNAQLTTHEILHLDRTSAMTSGQLPAFSPAIITIGSKGWTPPVDIFETRHAYHITVDLAGLSAEDAVVQITGRVITVSGERRVPSADALEKTYRRERAYGSFSRSFLLPPNANQRKISLDYQAGVLSMVIAKLHPANNLKGTGAEIHELSA
jgi:HSP20 family molecular chaperone IbpA